jgi:repressor LexA
MNERSQEILEYIRRFQREHGYPPTIREIGEAFGIASTNGVRYHLQQLEKAGHFQRSNKLSRGIVLSGGPSARPHDIPRGIPIVGRVAAGRPILAEESYEGRLDTSDLFGDPRGLFALRVRGDSMTGAGIYEGDYVIVQHRDTASPGDIVVALLDDEATVKYFRPRKDAVELVAANPKYPPIVVTEDHTFQICGIVKGVVRTL